LPWYVQTFPFGNPAESRTKGLLAKASRDAALIRNAAVAKKGLGALLSGSAEGQPAVWSRHASANDSFAFEDMVASLPSDVAKAARILIKEPGGRKMCFSEARKCAYVLWHRRADGVFTCTMFQDIASIDQAAELWDEIEKLSTPDTVIMTGLYAKITGFTLD
jgi:hypothetical protein